MPRVAVASFAMLLVAGAVLAAAEPVVETRSLDAGGVRLRVTSADRDAPWCGLLAVPPGGRAVLPAGIPGARLGGPVVMHGLTLVPLEVDPDPSGGALELDIAYVQDASPAAPRRAAETFARLLEAVAIGGASVRAELETAPGTYLLVAPAADGALEAVAPLLDWRRRQGYAVQAVTTAETGASAVQIRAHVQHVYDTADPPLAYICLAGDANGACAVPTFFESLSWYGGEGDHMYTMLDGDDALADAHVGRLTARSVTELGTIVQKILRYEREPDVAVDPGWFTRALLVGDPSHSGATTIYVNQWLKEQLLPQGYTQVDTIWAPLYPGLIFEAFNQGISVYGYRGYLNCSGFSTSYIDNLSNGDKLPLALLPTCSSGSFASYVHTYSEAMLRNPAGGAIGAIGTATTGTHTRYNNCYYHGTWEGAINEPDRHLGYAHTRGKIELFRQYQADEPDIVEIWSTWNNLMGDPATEMRQALPSTPTVVHPAVVPPDAGAVPVTVTVGGAPLAGVRVTLFRDAAVHATGRTDASGVALLPLPAGTTPGAIHVTVSGDDLYPHRGELLVGAVEAYCVAVGMVWDDGQDGMPDPGETADVTVQVHNLGAADAADVTVGLDARTDGVTVAGADVPIGVVPAGRDVPAGPWRVTLPGDLADGATVELGVAAGAPGATWSSRLDLPVSAPSFGTREIVWAGPPGETSPLTVTLHNDGAETAAGAVVTFATTSEFLLAAGPVAADLGDVPPGGQATAAFALTVPADAWGGHLAPCTLTVTTAAGTRQALELALPVGAEGPQSPVGPGALRYVGWDDLDPSPDAPTFAWRELAPSYGGEGADVGLQDFGYEQDDTRTVPLPFPFRFAGREHDQLSICSNGWAAFGATSLVHYRNWSLPAAGAPDAMLAVFWDDLIQSGANRVYHLYDEADGVYIVQWCRMANTQGGLQNCELLLYDPAVHPTATGEGRIEFQYLQVADNDYTRGYATSGIQDGTAGLTWTYYHHGAPGARPLQSGRAIAWVPVGPAAQAVMSLAPAAFDVVLPPGDTRDLEIEIANRGAKGSILRWQAGFQDGAPGLDWATLAPEGGTVAVGDRRIVTVSIDALGLAAGSHAADVVVSSNGGAPVVVPVRLRVDETVASPGVPTRLALAQNAPNPFNPRTTIRFDLPESADVVLTVHDLRGRRVRTLRAGSLPAGRHEVVFDGTADGGRRLASGAYLYRLVSGAETRTRRLVVVK